MAVPTSRDPSLYIYNAIVTLERKTWKMADILGLGLGLGLEHTHDAWL